MSRYISGGFGDMCQADEPEDMRPVCKHCGERHDGSYSYHDWCSPRCAILDNIGSFKRQVLRLISRGMNYEHVIYQLTFYDWFEGVSELSTDRWLRAIWARMDKKSCNLN